MLIKHTSTSGHQYDTDPIYNSAVKCMKYI